MTEHVTRWLNEYYDGALTGNRKVQVERHLITCTTCRDELAALTRLSSLLQEVPPPVLEIYPEQFTSQVNLRLSRKPQEALGQAGSISWQKVWPYLPLSLVGIWAFLQAFLVVAGLLIIGLSWNGVVESHPLAARLVGESALGWIWPALEITGLYWLGMLLVFLLFLSWLVGYVALRRGK